MAIRRTSNRREFITGQAVPAAVENLADLATEQREFEGHRSASGEAYSVQYQRAAMACQFALFLNVGQYTQGTEAALQALDLIEELESQLSIYRETSELSDINRRAADDPIQVEPRLFALLRQCVELHEASQGAFDITSGPLSKVWGFFRRNGTIPDDDALAEARSRVGIRNLEFHDAARTIRFARRGVELNLGSIGKGYALDRCGELLHAAGVNHFLWHGGNSSVLAAGDSAARAGGGGWSVGVADPLHPERRLAEIYLRDQALGTSGASVQFFRHQGKRYGHILDPRTGWPAEGVFSATAVASTAAEADALATAFYVLGVDAALDFCRRRPSVGAIVVYPSATGSKIEIATAGLGDDQWRLLSARA